MIQEKAGYQYFQEIRMSKVPVEVSLQQTRKKRNRKAYYAAVIC